MTSAPAEPPPDRSGGRASFFSIYPAIALPMFLSLVDQTIVATALPAIAGTFGNVEQVTWIVVAYLASAAIAAPVYGRLGDAFGRRLLLVVALAISAVASLFCAMAQSLEMLIVMRVLQGLGGGGLMSLSQALVGQAVAPLDRARYQGYLSATGVVASTLGPVAGALLTAEFGWRFVFLATLPLCLLAMVLALKLPSRVGARPPFRFDWTGLALLAVWIVAFLMALELVRQPPVEAGAASLLGLLAVAALALLVRRSKRAADPLLPLDVLANPTIWRSDIMALCQGATVISLATFVPICLRMVYGMPTFEIGLLMLPLTVGVGLGAMLTGHLVSRTGLTALFPSMGLTMSAIILTWLGFSVTWLSAMAFAMVLGVIAALLGTVMAVVQLSVQLAVGQERLGTAAASVQLARAVGAALGTAVVGATLFAAWSLAGGEVASLEALIQNQSSLAEGDLLPSMALARRDVAEAFRYVFFVLSGFSLIAAALAWSVPMRRI